MYRPLENTGGAGRSENYVGTWHESEAALDSLMQSSHPRLCGGIDIPQKVDRWWSRKGISINADVLSRVDLFALAGKTRSAEQPDWVTFLWHVLAWGVAGELRNAPTVVASAADQEGREQLNDLLGHTADLSFHGDIAGAYRAIYKQVPRLGPAFFTKFLYFTGDPASTQPRCLILDSRVASALFTLTGKSFASEKSTVYAALCGLLHQAAKRNDCPPDEVEFRLYLFGVLIHSCRWRWLHAEASLYREGAREVGFDDIVSRLGEQG